ncbi:hypothetical protein KSD_30070 [Ktedonobacter sp. SOSP1-85]|uniref:DUF4007 family protein n=1 Tax=Ktedonobacter sp. SOSP1-85 TaxID=2778367 RepID=UPI001914EE96|nr:DUF4007 family protein [Ktedonobacter sp. SOSP1-85]GHO75236.1 hypothetical protein KSD_30070 [Ktedonobacter sp. SOSP1-85]
MAFAKHETFYIREGWLYKGMAAIRSAEEEGRLPTVFLDIDAAERLGIGQNMVKSLRFWMQATGLAEEKSEERQRVQHLTPLGQLIWTYDRYLEDNATLWLLHYHLACSRDHATTWYWFFNHFAPSFFDDGNCLESLNNWVINNYADQEVAIGSLKRDIDCLLQTYLPSKVSRTPEELTESPFSRLGVLSRVGDNRGRQYRMERLDSARFHPLVLLYVLADRQLKARNGVTQVGLTDVLREPLNAGRVFSLTTTTLSDLLARLNKDYQDWRIQFVRTAGLDTLTLPILQPSDILARYYTERVSRREDI